LPPDASPTDAGRTPRIEWQELPTLPVGRANNAVAAVGSEQSIHLFSFLGIGAAKDHEDIVRDAYGLSLGVDASWRQIAPPTHSRGRVASIALTVGDSIYVIGGYTVDPDGHEVSVPDVDRFDATTGGYTPRAPMPTPVDDAVAGVWRDRTIVLVSGWSNTGNVADVQLYDTVDDTWSKGTPIIGSPVFGHGGAIVGDTIVYCGGAAVEPDKSPKYQSSRGCFAGALDATRPGIIDWQPIAHHEGPSRYRMACGAASGLVVCAGGTDNPYNYDGVGYDEQPSEPLSEVVAYEPATGQWHSLGDAPVATMDHRSLAVVGSDLFLIGGMQANQEVSSRAWRMRLSR